MLEIKRWLRMILQSLWTSVSRVMWLLGSVIMTRAGLPFTYSHKHVGVLTWKEEYLGCTRKVLLGSRNPEWYHDLPATCQGHRHLFCQYWSNLPPISFPTYFSAIFFCYTPWKSLVLNWFSHPHWTSVQMRNENQVKGLWKQLFLA